MQQTVPITMPQLGESVHEVTVSKWLVNPGEALVEFEPMLQVESDKVAAELPSPVTGILREILAPAGATVQVGAPIAFAELLDAEAPSGNVMPRGSINTSAKPPDPADDRNQERAPEPTAAPNLTTGGASHLTAHERWYSPSVRAAAQHSAIDLSRIPGTGIGGRVTKKDVTSAIDVSLQDRAGQSAEPTAPRALQPSAADNRVLLSPTRRLVAENMVRSKTTVPHAWQTQEVDMSGVVANRESLKAHFRSEEGFSLTYLPYVVAAAIAGLLQHSEVNATFGGDHIMIHKDINIGISVGTDDAVIVPVIKRADTLSIAGLAKAIDDLATRARANKLRVDDVQGGTFTVNNSGTFGTLLSYSVIVPGQAGILTMEAIDERPVAVQGMLAIRPMMYLCLSIDHRILDGLQAARFLGSCRTWLEAVTTKTPIY